VSRTRAYADVCSRMLTYAHVCSRTGPQASASCRELARMLTYAGVCWRVLTYADGCWRMLAYAGVCWHMLTYADVCWRMQASIWRRELAGDPRVAGPSSLVLRRLSLSCKSEAYTASRRRRLRGGTCFTCFTGTKVQILTRRVVAAGALSLQVRFDLSVVRRRSAERLHT
jgi:hypothetical protein